MLSCTVHDDVTVVSVTLLSSCSSSDVVWTDKAVEDNLLLLPVVYYRPTSSQLPFRVGTDEVVPVSVVRDLAIYIDSDVSMRSQVAKTVSACFAVLRQLRSVRRSVHRSVLQSLVTSLVLTRLDYGNATLVGIPRYQFNRFQSAITLLLGWCFLRHGTTISPHSSDNCTG